MARTESRAKVPAAVRRAEAVKLRIGGCSFREIASTLGCAPSRAYDLVVEGLRDYARPSAEPLLELELARMDQLLSAFWPQAVAGDLDAATFALRLIDRRCRLLGLDAPRRFDVRALVAAWATEQGLDPDETVAVVVDGPTPLLPTQ